MAETKEMITEEDIQRQQSLVSQLENEADALEKRVSDAQNSVDSLTAQIESLKNASASTSKPSQTDLDVNFEETITIMPKIYEELRKKYQMIENDPQVQILRDEVRKAELDTVYGPNPDYDKKSEALKKLLDNNKATLEDLKKQMENCTPTVVSQLDRILNRYNAAKLNPEDMYYPEFEADRIFLENLSKKYFPDEEVKSVFDVQSRDERLKNLNANREALLDRMQKVDKESLEYKSYQTQLDAIEKNIDDISHMTNMSIPEARELRSNLEEKVAKAKAELKKALDADFNFNQEFENKSKNLLSLQKELQDVKDYIQRATTVDPIDHLVSEYHKFRARVEQDRKQSSKLPGFQTEDALLCEIEKAAFEHYNNRLEQKKIMPSVPDNSEEIAKLEEKLKKAQDEHNQLVQKVNEIKAKHIDENLKLDDMVEQKKRQSINPFANTGDATIKANRWECKLQAPAKKGLVKIAMSTEAGKKIYERLRAKRTEKYTNKLNDLQEEVDVANANYSRISGNYDRLQNRYDTIQNLIDEASEIARLTNAETVDQSRLTKLQADYLAKLQHIGFDSTAITKSELVEKLDEVAEELEHFDYDQLEKLEKKQTKAEEKLERFKKRLEHLGATITPIEVELDSENLSKRKTRTLHSTNRFAVFFKNLKDKLTKNDDDDDYIDDEDDSIDDEKQVEEDEDVDDLAAVAFQHSSELNPTEYDTSSIQSEKDDTDKSIKNDEEDFSIPISQGNFEDAAQTVNPKSQATSSEPVLPVNPTSIFAHAPAKNQEEAMDADVESSLLGDSSKVDAARQALFSAAPPTDSVPTYSEGRMPNDDFWQSLAGISGSSESIDEASLGDSSTKSGRHR